jgi:hyperosmotically inducible periplasmic protein
MAYGFAATRLFTAGKEPMNALTRRTLPTLAAALVFALSAPTVIAQTAAPAPTWSQDDTVRIAKEVQKRLARLTNYGVFDWITFGFHGKVVVVKGYASRPILKKDVDNTLKDIAGVESVDNQIEVLPSSPNDDRIAAAVYSRIYTASSLRKYNANQGTARQATGPGRNIALMAGGITNAPPTGFHAIHIVVRNGNVTLFGVVNNEGDSAIANMQANSASGVFSVDNNLDVSGSTGKAAAK